MSHHKRHHAFHPGAVLLGALLAADYQSARADGRTTGQRLGGIVFGLAGGVAVIAAPIAAAFAAPHGVIRIPVAVVALVSTVCLLAGLARATDEREDTQRARKNRLHIDDLVNRGMDLVEAVPCRCGCGEEHTQPISYEQAVSRYASPHGGAGLLNGRAVAGAVGWGGLVLAWIAWSLLTSMFNHFGTAAVAVTLAVPPAMLLIAVLLRSRQDRDARRRLAQAVALPCLALAVTALVMWVGVYAFGS